MTALDPPSSRIAQLINGGAKARSPHQQQDEDWFLPYNGPYESPKPPPKLSVRRGWGGVQHGGTTTDTGTSDAETAAGWTSASEREDDLPRGRSTRRVTLAHPQPGRKSFASSVYTAGTGDEPPQRHSRVSAPSFLSLDDGGVGASPAPPVRASAVPSSQSGGGGMGVLAFYDRDPPPRDHRWSSLGNLLKRHNTPTSPLAAGSTRQRGNTLSHLDSPPPRPTVPASAPPIQQSSSMRGFPSTTAGLGLGHAYNQYGFTPTSTPAPGRTLRQKSSEPLLSTFNRPSMSTSPPQAHPYANVRPVQISRPVGIVHAPAHTFHASPPAPAHTQPATHSQPQTPGAQRLAPPQQTSPRPGGGGILRGLKSSLSSPNLRAAFSRLSPTPSNHTPSPKMYEAETWCDALLFPRPRFRAHVVSPPGSPDGPVMRERADLEVDDMRKEHPLEVIAQEVEREERMASLSRQGSKLRKRSRTRSKSVPRPPPPPTLAFPTSSPPALVPTPAEVVAKGQELDAERAAWAKSAERSFANKRSRSLSRSALRGARIRVQQADFVPDYPSATPGADAGRGMGVGEKLAVVAFAQGRGSSSHNSSQNSPSEHTRSGQSHSRSGHSRTTSLGTATANGHANGHRRSESWGRTLKRVAHKSSSCLDTAGTPTEERPEMGKREMMERALMRGDTVRLKVRSRDSEDTGEGGVLDIAPSPPHSASLQHARATPSPVVGLALSTPEPQPLSPQPEIVIHAHPYSPHSHSHAPHPSLTSNHSSIAQRHRMPPVAAEQHAVEPGKRMYALSRSGVIREVHPRDLAVSPVPSPALGRGEFPPHQLHQPHPLAQHVYAQPQPQSPFLQPPPSPQPSNFSYGHDGLGYGVDRTAGTPDIDVEMLGDERDPNGRPISIAPARARRERNARAYANGDADRTSTLGVEEVLSRAFNRMSMSTPPPLPDDRGQWDSNSPGRWDTSSPGQDSRWDASTPALTRAASEEAGMTLASSKLERSNPSLLNLLSRSGSESIGGHAQGSSYERSRIGSDDGLIMPVRDVTAIVEESEGSSDRKQSNDSLGLPSSASSPKVSPKPLGSMDDLELYHDLFWVPGNSSGANGSGSGSPRTLPRTGSALGLRTSANTPAPSDHAVPAMPALTHARKTSAGSVKTHTPRGSASSTRLPIGVAQTQSPQGRRPLGIQTSGGDREEQQAELSKPIPRTITTRSRSGTFGTQNRAVPVPQDVETEDEDDLQDTVRIGSHAVHSISVTTPRPEEEIHSAHPSLDGRYNYDEVLERLRASTFTTDSNADARLSVPHSANLQRASYATTATATSGSSHHFSLIENFPSPPTQELMSQAVLGYFAQRGQNPPRDDDHEVNDFDTRDMEDILREHHQARFGHGHGVLVEEDGDEAATEETAAYYTPMELPLPSNRATNRSTFGGEGDLADAWEAHPGRGAFRDD
ncbi:hypothetical protein EXIGLDRAFT_746720 [Exidia glandulosa HHB12029]|uniref:Uncharacterized protein n=1 Tax=Exidia glandulosa HHB12029 TaxID=1314781 RepID=A0A165LRW6_EXIGL|nr:hypothetical protein EXIGLDRAFT_746720 [Exidia glandulosa HHB12029]